MPITTYSQTTNVLTSRTYNVVQSRYQETRSDVQTWVTSLDKPLVSRRVKPTDLFAGSTAREVSSVVKQQKDAGLAEIPGVLPAFPDYNYVYTVGGDDPLKVSGTGIIPERLDISTFGPLNQRVLAKIKDQKVNLAVSVAEFGKTVDMAANLARDIFGAYRSLRSGRGLKEFIRDIQHPYSRASRKTANRWLELQYGWKPTMNDIYGLSEELGRRIIQNEYIYVEEKEVEKMPISYLYGNPYLCQGTDTIIRKVRARYMIDAPALKRASEVGITNPALVVWELIPYSFVIDWALDIGGYLASMDALVGTKNLLAVSSFKAVRDQTQYFYASTTPSYRRLPASAHVVWTITKRFAPSSSLPFAFPKYEMSANVKRLLNAMALLRQKHK